MTDGFHKAKKLTDEEVKLEAAMDDVQEAKRDEGRMLGLALILYFVGLPVFVTADEHSRAERIGIAVMFCALICFLIHILLGFRTAKKRYEAMKLADAYNRKKALPFFEELTEIFAKEPKLHIHLADDGRIVVTDNRKEEN